MQKTRSRDEYVMKNKIDTSVILTIVIYLLFFFSGATALVYQIVWTRKCILLLGSTAYAISSVLGIFFLGIGIGSILGGRLASISRNPLRIYGILEVFIGLWALFISEWLSSPFIVMKIFKLVPSSDFLIYAIRVSFAIFWFLFPSICMGMTYPLLARYDYITGKFVNAHLSLLYMANTIGATVGAFIAGFVAIPYWGYNNVLLVAVMINVLVGVLAWMVSVVIKGVYYSENEDSNFVKVSSATEGKSIEPIAYLGVFLSGFCSVALEVLWTRILIMIFLGTTYAYSSVLVSVLAGISLGSLLLSLVMKRLKFSLSGLGFGYFACGLFILLTTVYISYLPTVVQIYGLETSTDWSRAILGKFFLIFLVLVVPMLAFGFTFPYALSIIRSVSSVPYYSIGKAYGLNTVGSILGSVFGGFIILPLMGCEFGIKLLGLTLALFGIVISLFGNKGKRVAFLGSASVLGLCLSILPSSVMKEINKFYLPTSHKLMYFSEGVEGTVAVSAPPVLSSEDERVLWINRVQATTAVEKGVHMNRFQGILPWLFDRNPRSALFMCFGSGITCGTLAVSGFEKVDAVEISPEVIEASKCFSDKNLDVLSRPNVKVHIDDARNFLIRSKEKYDFITLEPMPLALAGVSVFYSEDFYNFCMNAMNSEGMMSQWVPFHSTDPFIVKSVVATFLRVFPEAKAFFVNSDLFIVGSKKSLVLDPQGLKEKLRVNKELEQALYEARFRDVEEIFATFVMDREALIKFSKGGRIITDRTPWVEFSSPKYIYYRGSVPANIRNLIECYTFIERVLKIDNADSAILTSVIQRHKSHYSDLEGIIRYYEGFIISDDIRKPFLNSLSIDPKNRQAKYYLRVISKTQIEKYLIWEEEEKVKQILAEVTPYLKDDEEWNEWLSSKNIPMSLPENKGGI
ncbi:MAG: fused MFS/spermidine synthase [Candidatus Hydrogenedentes bacterium]|nr:fused MFS/spermidine synthase [Candidatus Hydrogenedentota bacterium]